VNCVSKGGNLMLNVAPDAKGHLDPEVVRICSEVGDWLERNTESIRGCGIAEVPKPEWGRFTQRGRQLYAHLLEPVIGHVNLPGLRGHVKDARLVASGAEAIICDYWNPGIQTFDDPEDIFFNLGPKTAATYPLPDRQDTVVRFTLTDEAEREHVLEGYRQAYQRATEWRPM
jgi:alpha-L-fucosidase